MKVVVAVLAMLLFSVSAYAEWVSLECKGHKAKVSSIDKEGDWIGTIIFDPDEKIAEMSWRWSDWEEGEIINWTNLPVIMSPMTITIIGAFDITHQISRKDLSFSTTSGAIGSCKKVEIKNENKI